MAEDFKAAAAAFCCLPKCIPLSAWAMSVCLQEQAEAQASAWAGLGTSPLTQTFCVRPGCDCSILCSFLLITLKHLLRHWVKRWHKYISFLYKSLCLYRVSNSVQAAAKFWPLSHSMGCSGGRGECCTVRFDLQRRCERRVRWDDSGFFFCTTCLSLCLLFSDCLHSTHTHHFTQKALMDKRVLLKSVWFCR